MAFGYRFRLERQRNGWWLVRFPGIPEALTEGETESEARRNAVDCVIAALEGYMKAGRPLPRQGAGHSGPDRAVLPSLVTAKLAVYETMLAALLMMIMAISLPVLANAQPSSAHSAPVIYSIEPTSAPAGEQITIIGRGFSAGNTVHLGGKSIYDVSIAWSAGINCVQGNSTCHPGINQALVIRLPRDATAGLYDVSVENENGVSNIVTFSLIGTPPAPVR